MSASNNALLGDTAARPLTFLPPAPPACAPLGGALIGRLRTRLLHRRAPQNHSLNH